MTFSEGDEDVVGIDGIPETTIEMPSNDYENIDNVENCVQINDAFNESTNSFVELINDEKSNEIESNTKNRRVNKIDEFNEKLLRVEEERLAVEKERLKVEQERLLIEKSKLRIEIEKLRSKGFDIQIDEL